MLNTTLLQGDVPLGIALSGGSDSTALLILATDAFGPQNLRAITINHGLREGALGEAQQAAKLCASLGVSHTIQTLTLIDGPDLQARARAARYAALAAWALENKIAAIALGHTKDDVSETFLMRLARGSGVDGLATMKEQFERGGAHFKRPLLKASRADLQNVLKARGIGWSTDPSNDNPRFTRVKMRQSQPVLDELGLTSERLSQTADWMRAASEVLEHAADLWIASHAYAEHGDAVLNIDALRAAPKETAYRVLTRVLCRLSGNPYRPRFSALGELVHGDVARTLHGCLIYHHIGTLRVAREVNALNALEDHWQIDGPRETNDRVVPLGQAGLNTLENWRETALLPRKSLIGSPAIWRGDKLIAAPIAQPTPEWHAIARHPFHLSK